MHVAPVEHEAARHLGWSLWSAPALPKSTKSYAHPSGLDEVTSRPVRRQPCAPGVEAIAALTIGETSLAICEALAGPTRVPSLGSTPELRTVIH